MERSGSQKVLHVVSIFAIIGGVATMLISIMAFLGGGFIQSLAPAEVTSLVAETGLSQIEASGLMIMLGIFALIVLRSADIALRSASAFHALLALGCAGLLAVQTFIIIGGITKLIPMTGVTVPFLSYGGTSLVSCMAVLGVVQGVANRNERMLREDRRLAGEDTP